MTAFLTAAGKTPEDCASPSRTTRPRRSMSRRVVPGRRRGADRAPGRADRGLEGRLPRHEGDQVTIGGKDITKGDFGEDAIASYLFVQ